MSREEAAAKGLARHKWPTAIGVWESFGQDMQDTFRDQAQAALRAADAHDQANGIHRVTLDELTKAIYDVDPLKFMGDVEPTPWEKLGPAWRALAKSKAEAVIARITELREASDA